MGDMFHRLAPYIQDYIYANNWTELREIQVAACHAVFDTDENLLLSSGTASGQNGGGLFAGVDGAVSPSL